MVKTYFATIKIPGITAMDYHLVGGTSKLLEDFHREYNKDANARCTAWEPATFSSAPDATKHRTAEFATQMKAPGWLLKIIGRSTLPVRDHQTTTLNRKTGNITFYSKPILLTGPKGEFSIAEMHMDILNRVEPDGSPFVTIDVTVTAKADYAWLWGMQTAVESIFISQAKDDIGAYLQSNIRTCQELVPAGKVPSQLGINTDDHLGMPGAAPEEAETLRPLPNGGHAKAPNGSVALAGAGKGALYTNDSVSVYYDASEKMRRPSGRSVEKQQAAAQKPVPKQELEKQKAGLVDGTKLSSATPRVLSPQGAPTTQGGAGPGNGTLSPRTPGKTTSILRGAQSPRSSTRKGMGKDASARHAPSTSPTGAPPAVSGSQTERRSDQRDKVRRICQAWAEESVPMQPKSARARIGDTGRSAANHDTLSPRDRERIRVTTPATSWETAEPAAGDAPPVVKAAAGGVPPAVRPAAGAAPPAAKPAAPETADDPAHLREKEETETTIDREGKYYIIMPASQERFHTPANSILPINQHEEAVPAAVVEAPKTPAVPRGLRRVQNQSPTPAQRAARRPPLTRKSASSLAHRHNELLGPNHNGSQHDMVNGGLLSPQKSISAPGTPRGRAPGPNALPRNQKWQDDSANIKSEKRRPAQAARTSSGVRFQPGAAVEYEDARWPGHIVAVDPLSPTSAFPSAKRATPVHLPESPFAGMPHTVAKPSPMMPQTTTSSEGVMGKPHVDPGLGRSATGAAQAPSREAMTNGASTAPAGRKVEKPNWFAKTFCGCSTPASE